MRLAAHGIETDLPPGWEGRITRRTEPTGLHDRTGARGTPGERTHPVVHLANFALPEDRGDYGSGAVELMTAGHVLVVLFEFGPESIGRALFATDGMPRQLTPAAFSPHALQRTLTGQAGCQRFFTETGRAFCLYVVLGAYNAVASLVPNANAVLRATRIGPR